MLRGPHRGISRSSELAAAAAEYAGTLRRESAHIARRRIAAPGSHRLSCGFGGKAGRSGTRATDVGGMGATLAEGRKSAASTSRVRVACGGAATCGGRGQPGAQNQRCGLRGVAVIGAREEETARTRRTAVMKRAEPRTRAGSFVCPTQARSFILLVLTIFEVVLEVAVAGKEFQTRLVNLYCFVPVSDSHRPLGPRIDRGKGIVCQSVRIWACLQAFDVLLDRCLLLSALGQTAPPRVVNMFEG